MEEADPNANRSNGSPNTSNLKSPTTNNYSAMNNFLGSPPDDVEELYREPVLDPDAYLRSMIYFSHADVDLRTPSDNGQQTPPRLLQSNNSYRADWTPPSTGGRRPTPPPVVDYLGLDDQSMQSSDGEASNEDSECEDEDLEAFFDYADELECERIAEGLGLERRPDGEPGYVGHEGVLLTSNAPPFEEAHENEANIRRRRPGQVQEGNVNINDSDVERLVNYSPSVSSVVSGGPSRARNLLVEIDSAGEIRLDGLVFLGKCWNIARIDGSIQIYKKIDLVAEKALSYKGIPEATLRKFRYEMTFATIDNLKLSLLIVSDTNKEVEKEGKRERISYSKMCQAFLDTIKHVTMQTNGTTRWQYAERGQGQLTIFEEDWMDIGKRLRDCLLDRDFQDIHSVFPENFDFFFLLKKFGQDQAFQDPRRQDPHHNPYPNVQMNFVRRTIVHVAYDFCLPDHVLYFNPEFFKKVKRMPTHKFNPGIIPDTGNYVYTSVPQNSYNIAAIQQYTRLFHAIHRNEYKFFETAFIIQHMLRAYTCHLNGKSWKQLPDAARTVKWLLNGTFRKMYLGLRESLQSHRPIKSRCEFIWSFDHLSHFERWERETEANGVHLEWEDPKCWEIIQRAVRDATAYKIETGCADPTLFTVYAQSVIVERTTNLIDAFFDDSLCRGVKKLSDFLSNASGELPSMDTVLTLSDFASMYVAEGMMRRIVRGDLQGFMKSLQSLVVEHLDEFDNLLDWPFIQDPHHGVWLEENEDGTRVLKTSVPIARIFRNHTHIMEGVLRHVDLLDLHEAYRTWSSARLTGPVQAWAIPTEALFKEISFAFLKRLGAHNSVVCEDRREVVNRLWDQEQANPTPRRSFQRTVCVTGELYEKIMSISRSTYPDFHPFIMFMELIRERMTERMKGGTQLSLSALMDNIIYEAEAPLILKLKSYKTVCVFVPYTLSKPKFDTDKVARIYQKAFEWIYNRRAGISGIHVCHFLRPIIGHTLKCYMNQRSTNVTRLFKIINKMLDSDSVTNTNEFEELPRKTREILLKVYREHHPLSEVIDLPPSDGSLVSGFSHANGNAALRDASIAPASSIVSRSTQQRRRNRQPNTESQTIPRRITRSFARQQQQQQEEARRQRLAQEIVEDILIGNAPDWFLQGFDNIQAQVREIGEISALLDDNSEDIQLDAYNVDHQNLSVDVPSPSNPELSGTGTPEPMFASTSCLKPHQQHLSLSNKSVESDLLTDFSSRVSSESSIIPQSRKAGKSVHHVESAAHPPPAGLYTDFSSCGSESSSLSYTIVKKTLLVESTQNRIIRPGTSVESDAKRQSKHYSPDGGFTDYSTCDESSSLCSETYTTKFTLEHHGSDCGSNSLRPRTTPLSGLYTNYSSCSASSSKAPQSNATSEQTSGSGLHENSNTKAVQLKKKYPRVPLFTPYSRSPSPPRLNRLMNQKSTVRPSLNVVNRRSRESISRSSVVSADNETDNDTQRARILTAENKDHQSTFNRHQIPPSIASNFSSSIGSSLRHATVTWNDIARKHPRFQPVPEYDRVSNASSVGNDYANSVRSFYAASSYRSVASSASVGHSSTTGSDVSHTASAFSRGAAFRYKRRVATTTSFDHALFRGDVMLPNAVSTNNSEDGDDDNDDNMSVTSSAISDIAPWTGTPPRRGSPFSEEETRRVFTFMHGNKWLLYMRGNRLSDVMSALKIVPRTSQSILSHIKCMVKKPDLLRTIIGEDMVREILRNDKRIAKRSRLKKTNVLPLHVIQRRYKVRLV